MKNWSKNDILVSIGFVLLFLGAAAGDSENLIIPLIMMAVGGTLMLKYQYGVDEEDAEGDYEYDE